MSFDLMVLALPAIVAAALTGLVRAYALKHLIDIPNARSSHRTPTPRGGGVGIVAAFLLAAAWLLMAERLSPDVFLALAGGGLAVAAVGFWDDHGHISARWRMLVHLLAAVWSLYWLGGLEPLQISSSTSLSGWPGAALACLFIVWMLNLFNFMDGIDGLAGVETLFVAMVGALIVLVPPEAGRPSDSGLLLLTLAAATAGFLVWNWPPAKIFMGDVGSGFLGLTLAVVVIVTVRENQISLIAWLILLGVFLVDATLTLLRRLLSGRRWYEAHRSHAYQQAALKLKSHQKVTLAVAAINVAWLLPWALCSLYWPRWAVVCLAAAYAPLIVLALTFDAGRSPAETGFPSN